MALLVQQLLREFKYNGMALADPGAQMSAEEVKTFYANIYPELNNAAIEGPDHVANKAVYEFRRAVGTKGNDETAPASQWAIVELFGHQRIAGRISEHTIGGCSFVRIDVPELPASERIVYGEKRNLPPLAGYTKLYGNGAIYAITFVDEAIATAAAAEIRAVPVDAYGLQDALNAMDQKARQRLLGAPEESDDD